MPKKGKKYVALLSNSLWKIGVLLSVASVVAVVLFVLLFFGGFEGLVRVFQPAPDFTKGEPAANRQKAVEFESKLLELLPPDSVKTYGPATHDRCEKLFHSFQSKPEELAACHRSFRLLQLTDKSPAEVYAELKSKVENLGIRVSNTGASQRKGYFISADNSDHSFQDVPGSVSYAVEIYPASEHLPFGGNELYLSDGKCQGWSYCFNQSSEIENWDQYVVQDRSKTVVYTKFSASHYYFK